MRFNKIKCKVLYPGHSNLHYEYKLGNVRMEHSPAEKHLGYWWMASWTWASNEPLQPRKPTISLAASKEAGPAGQGQWSCPSALCWWDLTWSTVSRWGVISTGETWTWPSASRAGPLTFSKGWNTSPTRTGLWDLELFSLKKRRLWGDPRAAFQYVKGGL